MGETFERALQGKRGAKKIGGGAIGRNPNRGRWGKSREGIASGAFKGWKKDEIRKKRNPAQPISKTAGGTSKKKDSNKKTQNPGEKEEITSAKQPISRKKKEKRIKKKEGRKGREKSGKEANQSFRK